MNAEGRNAPAGEAVKTSGSYCFGYKLKLPSGLQSSSVAESNGSANKTFYQKVFVELFSKSSRLPRPPSPLNYNLAERKPPLVPLGFVQNIQKAELAAAN